MTFTQEALQTRWLKALLFVLFGYCLLGRAFAYTFAGELVLAIGVVIFLVSRRISLIFSDPVLVIWAMFALWGLYRTIPFIPIYGIEAPRDAVVWGYGVMALLIVAFVNSSTLISRALNSYRKFLKWYLPVLPAIIYLAVSLGDAMPKWPWAHSVAVIALRGGEAGVHLAGAALFLLIFSDRRSDGTKGRFPVWHIAAFLGIALSTLVLAMESRGGFVAMVIPIMFVSTIRAKTIGWRVVGFGLIAVVVGLVVLGTHPPKIKGRTFTPGDVVNVVASIAGSEDGAKAHSGTKKWRLHWWKKILHYTFEGPYFWTGRGFGINLAQADKPSGISDEETKLRSPHNGHMTVIARTGVPGTLLWIALNVTFAFRVFRAYKLGQRTGSRYWSGLNLWILCYWMAAVINMSFDVYLEGPQGGIWYWSLIGLGTAAYRLQIRETRQAAARAALDARTIELEPEGTMDEEVDSQVMDHPVAQIPSPA
jgi:hypothetical protein